MFVTSAGRGDDEPFRPGGTDVRRGVEALVAIGDGVDADRTPGACGSSCGGKVPHEVGGCTRRRTIAIAIAMVVVAGTTGSEAVDGRAGAAAVHGVWLDRG